MFTDAIDAEGVTPAELEADYYAALAATLAEAGVEEAAAQTGLDVDFLAAVRDGDADDVTVEEATEVLALSETCSDAETLRLELRDHVMLQMSSAVVDVETLAAGIDDDLDAKEVQQRIEGRQPMTLGEYARIAHYLDAENPW